MRIGIYGGAFSPITIGHTDVANYIATIMDRIYLMPCNRHMWGKSMVEGKHRLAMCHLAVGNPKLFVSDFEIRNDLPGDTFTLVSVLKKRFRKDSLYFIIGMDEANNFRKWKKYRQLLKMIKFIVVFRPGTRIKKETRKLFCFPHIISPPNPFIAKTSSSEVRNFLKRNYTKNNPFLKKQINRKVLDYIFKHKLYREGAVQ